MSAGEYIFDAHGAIWLRFGSNIVHASAMCNWNGYLVIGHGAASAANLIYANWSSETEVDGSGTGQNITSNHRTPNFDFGIPECDKQVRGILVMYRDDDAWTSETITVQYRIDEAVTAGLPSFTSMGTISLGTDDKTHVKFFPLAISNSTGKFFQFQFTSTGHLDILQGTIYFDVLPFTYASTD